jgi:hypothetical protein
MKRSSCDSGQRERADLVRGILRRDHEERLGQGTRLALGRDLPLFHRFEQRRLRLRARAVHLVREHQLGEDRSGMEAELPGRGLEHRDAEDVGRQQVRGELHALEAQAENPRDRERERGLADPGNVFDQQVPAREQAREREANLVGLAEDDVVEGGKRLIQAGIQEACAGGEGRSV